MTKKSSTLAEEIEHCEIDHTHFLTYERILGERITDAIEGRNSDISILVAPSRAGKSRLLARLKRAFPESRQNGNLNVPFAVGNVGSSTSPKDLPKVTLAALDLPMPNEGKKLTDLKAHTAEQIRVCGTRALGFDEVSAALAAGATVKPAALAHYFKDLRDTQHVAQLLFGVPRLLKLLETTEEFRNRCFKELVWMPYDVTRSEDVEVYGKAVNTYLQIFQKHGWTFDEPPEVIAANVYLHAPGLIGKMHDLMLKMAQKLPAGGPRIIKFSQWRQVAAELQSAGPPESKPFTSPTISKADLHLAYRYVLEKNDLGSSGRSK